MRRKFSKAIQTKEFEPPQKISPYERGVKFEIPMLCLDFGRGAKSAESEEFLSATWKLTGNYDTDLPNFRKDIAARIYEFDIAGHKVKEKYIGDDAENLFRGETNWTLNELVNRFT